MTNPLYTISELPSSSQAAFQDFDDRYVAGIGAATPPTWADIGDSFSSTKPQTNYPIASLALKYMQTEGENRFKTILKKALSVRVEEFDAGVEAPMLQLLSDSGTNKAWQNGPNRMLIAEARLRNRSIVNLLEAGATTNWVDGVPFFSAAHPADMNNASSATWSNYQSTTKDPSLIANLAAEISIMQGALDENGEKVGAYPTHILLPTAKFEPTKNMLAQQMILGGPVTSTSNGSMNNPYYNRLIPVHVPELNATNDWYLVDQNLLSQVGLPPWITMRYVVPDGSLGLRRYDETSDFFKDTGRIKVSSHVWYGFALAFPHAIRLVRGQ